MDDNFKPWHHWWFWLLMIPLAGILIPLSELLPVREWWFWMIGSVIGLKLYSDFRARSIGGKLNEIKQLKGEVAHLRAQLALRRATESLVDRRDLVEIEKVSLSQGIVVIFFSDIESFTSFVEYHGDHEAYERLKLHNQIVRNLIRQFNGIEVKHLGDGFMVSFTSARDALACASHIQIQIDEINDEQTPLRVRIGIHAGEPIREDHDFVGRTVNLSQRIMSQANGGQVYVSEVVKTLVGPMKGFQYVDQGVRRLEGISEPQQLYEFHPIQALSAPLETVVDERLENLEQHIKGMDAGTK